MMKISAYKPLLRLGSRLNAILVWLSLIASSALGQVAIDVAVINETVAQCDCIMVTNRLVNIGETLSDLSFTNELPSADYLYVPGLATITLPGGAMLTNASADPVVSADGTKLSWDFTSVVSEGGVDHLLLSEVMYYPSNSDNYDENLWYQWVEIFNPTPDPVEMIGWALKDASPGQTDIIPDLTISSGEYVIVAANADRFYENYPGFSGQLVEVPSTIVSNGIGGNGLNYFMDGIALLDDQGKQVDAMSYGASTDFLSPPAPLVPKGHSLARRPANQDRNSASDWVDQAVPDPGQGIIQGGINNGDVISVSYYLYVTCSAIPGTMAATSSFRQPPESDPSYSSETVLLNPLSAALIVSKTPLLQSRKYMETLTWDLTVKNEGYGRAANVALRDVAGPGIELIGFDPAPASGTGAEAVWDGSVIPKLLSLDPGEEVTVQITARCTGCSGLYGDADASWGCADGPGDDEVCHDTADHEGTARATIDFISEPPLLSGSLTPSAPIQVPYCSGVELRFCVTNAPNAGPARNIQLNVALPEHFEITGDNVSGGDTIILDDLDPGDCTQIIVNLHPSDSAASTDLQYIYVSSEYEDLCGKTFSALALISSFQLTSLPGATIRKVMPETFSVGNTTTTAGVTIYLTYSNLEETVISFQDVYPKDPDGLISVKNVNPAAIDDGTNLSWTLQLSGTGVETFTFDLEAQAECDKAPSLLFNTLIAPDFVDCRGGVRPVLGDGQAYPLMFFPRDCREPDEYDCSYSSTKQVAPELAEACAEVIITQVFKFHGDLSSASWSGSSFWSDLGGAGGSAVNTGAITVLADGEDVTSFVSLSQTSPSLVIDLSGLQNSDYDAPDKLDDTTEGLKVIYSLSHTNVGWVHENSGISGTVCSGGRGYISWLQGESRLGIALSVITNNNACGVSEVTISLTNLPSPQILGADQGTFPAYNLLVNFDLDADEDLSYSYDYVTSSARFDGMIAPDGSPIAGFEPTVNGSLLSWNVGDVASNGAGSISFSLRGSCSAYSDERHAAWVEYNSLCDSDVEPRNERADSSTNAVPPLFKATLYTSIQPEYAFLTTTQYVTRIEVINSGAGVAYNVRPEMDLPGCLAFGDSSVPALVADQFKVTWGDFIAGFGDLDDLDGDGQFDDLPPNGRFEIWVTNHVVSCQWREMKALTRHGCKGEDCEQTPVEAVASHTTAGGQITTRLAFPTSLFSCEEGTAEYELRNAGVVELRDVEAAVVLPLHITYVPGSSWYTLGGGAPVQINGEPSGDGSSGNPLVWDSSLIPALAKMQPLDEIKIQFDFPIICEVCTCDGVFELSAKYTDICGVTNASKQVKVMSDIRTPDLGVTVQAGSVGGPYVSGLIVRDLGEQYQYRVLVSHKETSRAAVPSVSLDFDLPENAALVSASPVPSSQSGSTLSWDRTALLGGAAFELDDDPIEVFITVEVDDCMPDTQALAEVDYGCIDDACHSTTGSHSLRTKPLLPTLSSLMGLNLRTCGGTLSVIGTNQGSTATGIVVNAAAPDGYLFTKASVSGYFSADPAEIVLGGSPAGKTAVLNLTTNSLGESLRLPFGEAFRVEYELISDGANLDYLANPLDLNFADPDPPMPSEVTAACQMDYNSLCGDAAQATGSSKTYPDMPDPDIDLQPNCEAINIGDEQVFTVTVRNNSQRGNAGNLHIRLRFGSAWTDVDLKDYDIKQRDPGGTLEYEVSDGTNVLISLPGVVIDPVDDYIKIELEAKVGSSSGTLDVLAEVVGDCGDSRIIPLYPFTNTLGEAALADTMTGNIIGPVGGRYYSFDQDRSSFIVNDLFKNVRYPHEDSDDASEARDARVGESVVFQIGATFFGGVFSNISITDSLPDGCVFGAPQNYAYIGNITGSDYNPTTGIFTIEPEILDATTFSSFYVEIPAVVANELQNQDGFVITNTASIDYRVLGFTNELPSVDAYLPILEPDLRVVKSGSTNLLRSGDVVWFTNTISHSGSSRTNAYNLVFKDTLPKGLTFNGVNLLADNVDNNDDGSVDNSLEGTLIQDDGTIIISFTNHPHLQELKLGETRSFVFSAIVSNQTIGSEITNSAWLSWMSHENLNNDERRTGDGGINDYTNVSPFKLKSMPMEGAVKSFVSSSQTNTFDGQTNDLTVGERIIYELRVDVPDGVVSNLVITERPPQGLDFVGSNPDIELTYPGYGYEFFVPHGGGLALPTTTAEGLVITDSDPTPASSTTTDGSGKQVRFAFPAFTNTYDGIPENNYFTLRMEFVILDEAINKGIGSGARTGRNVFQVTDAFQTIMATGPVYRVVEPDVRIAKTISPDIGDAFDVVTISLVVSNNHQALASAYNVEAADILDDTVFDSGTVQLLPPPAGWAVKTEPHSDGLKYTLSSEPGIALPPGSAVTGVLHIALAESVSPGKVYLNSATVDGHGLYDEPPSGIPERKTEDDAAAYVSIYDMDFEKTLYGTSESTHPPDSEGADVQIGEIVTYELTATLPDGATKDLTFYDAIPSNMAFVVGSVVVDDSSFDGDFNPTPTVTPSSGLLGGDGEGVSVVFNGQTITRAHGDSNKNKLKIRLSAIVLNNQKVSGIAPHTVLTNSATLTYDGNPDNPVQSSDIEVRVLEPGIGIVKRLSTQKVDAGDNVDVTLVLTNSGTATAYDIEIVDGLPAKWFEPGTVVPKTVPTGFTIEEENNAVYLRSDPAASRAESSLQASNYLEFVFQVSISGAVSPNESITNTATVSADSVSGADVYGAQRSTYATNSASMTNADFALVKSVFASSESVSPPDSTGNDAQVGEIFTYQLQARLPEGTIEDMEITDYIPEGMAFVVGSLQVDASSLNGTLGSPVNVSPSSGVLGGNGEDLKVTFAGSTIVAGDNNPNNDILRLRYDVVVLNTSSVVGLPAPTWLTNIAEITCADNPSQPVASDEVAVKVIEPSIDLTKKVTPDFVDAGDLVTVSLVISNSGTAAAYNIEIDDALPASYLDPGTVLTNSVPSGYILFVSNNAVRVRSDPEAASSSSALQPGGTAEFVFQARAAQNLPPNVTFTNRAALKVNSLFEQNVAGQARYYGSGAEAVLGSPDIAVSKRLVGSTEKGELDAIAEKAQIGEILTFELVADLPEGTIKDLAFTDYMPTGMAYVADSAELVTTNFNGTVPGVITVDPDTTPLCGPGETVIFTLTGDTVVLADNQQNNNKLRLRFDALVTDSSYLTGLGQQRLLTNSASLTFADNPSNAVVSGDVVLTIIEPSLSLEKTFDIARGDAGDWVTTTLKVSNSGTGPAFHVAVTDQVVGAYFNISTIENLTSPLDGWLFDVATAGANARVRYRADPSSSAPDNVLAAGGSRSFSFRARLSEAVTPGLLVENAAVIDVADTVQNTTPFGSGRDKSGAEDDTSLDVPNLTIAKVLLDTSEKGESDTAGSDVTIGEEAIYLITVTLPEGTTRDLVVVDATPVGMSYVPGSVQVPAVIGISRPGGTPQVSGGVNGSPLVISFPGDLVVAGDNDPSNNKLNIRFAMRVLDVPANDGVPASAGGSGPVELGNMATVAFDSNPPVDTSEEVKVRVVEPVVNLMKTMGPPSNNWVEVGLSIENVGLATAFDLVLEDYFPTSLWNTATLAPIEVPEGFDWSVEDVTTGAVLRVFSDPASQPPTNCLAVNQTNWFFFSARLQEDLTVSVSNILSITNYTTLNGDSPYERKEPNKSVTNELGMVPGVAIFKWLEVDPPARDIEVGEVITFSILATNIGPYELATVYVEDRYPERELEYVSSIPAADLSEEGKVAWNNVGPIQPYEAVELSVTFKVLASQTEPRLDGIDVFLYDEQSNLLATAQTGADGSYFFTAIPAASYLVQFSPPSNYTYTIRHAGLDPAVNSDAMSSGWTEPISLAVGETNNTINAGLFEYVTISGLAWNDRNANGIREDDELLIEGIVFTLYSNDTAICSQPSAPDGAYSFTHLPPGTYYVEAEFPTDQVITKKHASTDLSLDNDFDPVSYRSDPQTLAFGESATNVDLGVYLPTAEIVLRKTVNVSDVELNGEVAFSLIVSNQGPNVATDLIIRDLLSPPFEYLGHAGGDYSRASGDWTIAELGPGAVTSLFITVAVTNLGCYTNLAEVVALEEYNPAQGDGVAEVEVCATCITSLEIQVVPEQARWTLQGPPDYLGATEGVGSFGPILAPTGTYIISYQKLPAYRTPPGEQIQLNRCDELKLVGNYVRLCRLHDFDGDGATDLAVYHEETGTWYVLNPLTYEILFWALPWGGQGFIPLVGDFDGDGIADFSLYKPATDPYSLSTWYIMREDGTLITFALEWGCYDFIPIVGDFDGDGACDLGVYDNVSGNWYARNIAGDLLLWEQKWGGPGYVPLVGDFDGDGRTDVAVFEDAVAAWYAATKEGVPIIWNDIWGASGWTPVPADYSGNDVWDMAVYNQATGSWFIKDPSCECLLLWDAQWGGPGFVPVIGDFDGDGAYDLAVYEEQTGLWYAITLDGRILFWGLQWGGAGFTTIQ